MIACAKDGGRSRPRMYGDLPEFPFFAVACRIWLAPSTVEHDDCNLSRSQPAFGSLRSAIVAFSPPLIK